MILRLLFCNLILHHIQYFDFFQPLWHHSRDNYNIVGAYSAGSRKVHVQSLQRFCKTDQSVSVRFTTHNQFTAPNVTSWFQSNFICIALFIQRCDTKCFTYLNETLVTCLYMFQNTLLHTYTHAPHTHKIECIHSLLCGWEDKKRCDMSFSLSPTKSKFHNAAHELVLWEDICQNLTLTVEMLSRKLIVVLHITCYLTC